MKVVGLYKVTSCEESLVAYEHAFLETFPVQVFWRSQAAHVQEMSFFVHNGCVTIQYIRKCGLCNGVYHQLESIVLMQFVTCIQEAEVIAGGQFDSLVHGIIQSFIRLTDYGMYMFLVLFNDL